MMEFIAQIWPYMIPSLFVCIMLFIFSRAAASKPLFKMRCKDCGCKDKDWKIVPIGHDNFAWQHNCPEDTPPHE
ncbi:MAG: hypothetical protein KAS32_28380 [Candidatus Peribacteraceae bacterium]|nr:hypothetical protein [Candidatus Peribacteraceae bacterium]